MSIAQPRTDEEYEARWDAETLANAERIKADPNRLSSAQSAAKALADQQTEDQKVMRKVAKPAARREQAPQSNAGMGTTPPRKQPAATRRESKGGFNVFQKIS